MKKLLILLVIFTSMSCSGTYHIIDNYMIYIGFEDPLSWELDPPYLLCNGDTLFISNVDQVWWNDRYIIAHQQAYKLPISERWYIIKAKGDRLQSNNGDILLGPYTPLQRDSAVIAEGIDITKLKEMTIPRSRFDGFSPPKHPNNGRDNPKID